MTAILLCVEGLLFSLRSFLNKIWNSREKHKQTRWFFVWKFFSSWQKFSVDIIHQQKISRSSNNIWMSSHSKGIVQQQQKYWMKENKIEWISTSMQIIFSNFFFLFFCLFYFWLKYISIFVVVIHSVLCLYAVSH